MLGSKGAKGKAPSQDMPTKGKAIPVPTVQEPPQAKLASKPSPASAASAACPQAATAVEERRLLTELLTAINKDQLSPDLQRRLGQFAQTEVQQQGRHMHKLVSEKTQLRKELDQLRVDRAAYNAAWEAYVVGLLELWEKQGDARLEAMAKFAATEEDLAVRLANATQALAQAAQDEDQSNSRGPQLIDDDMDEEEEAELAVDMAIEVEAAVRARNRAAQEQLKEQNARVQGLLQQARQDAAAAAAATTAPREGSRTPRRKQKSAEGANFGVPTGEKPDDKEAAAKPTADAKNAAPSTPGQQPPPGGAR